MGKKMSNVKQYTDDPTWERDVKKMEFPPNETVLIRPVGDVEVVARHWAETQKGKNFPLWCTSFDPEDESWSDRACLCHDDFGMRAQKLIVGNCIDRKLQQRGDNPVRVYILPSACLDDISLIAQQLKADPADVKNGVDLAIVYNPKAAGNKKWTIQRTDRSPLTPDEKKLNFYNLPKIVPDYNDPDVLKKYLGLQRKSLGRNKYYVKQINQVAPGMANPFKAFQGDITSEGKPWHHFQALVDYRNKQEADAAGTKYTYSGGQDGTETVVDSDDPTPPGQGRVVNDEDDLPSSLGQGGQGPDPELPPVDDNSTPDDVSEAPTMTFEDDDDAPPPPPASTPVEDDPPPPAADSKKKSDSQSGPPMMTFDEDDE